MATPTNLKVDGLAYEQIRDNLKQFLSNQDQFKDYNFEGSGLAVLLDVLAYNTYYNSFYLNMMSTETSLATAQQRNSVVNLAKTLNYTPRSTTSARITGSVELAVSVITSSYTLPKYTKFSASLDGQSYTFLTDSAITIFANANSEYIAENVTLIEGVFASERYVVNTSDKDQRFIINNELVDTSTLSVRVLNSASDSTTRVFTLADNFVEVAATSLVYFLEEIEDGKYQVKFGDGVLGAALTNGNVVYLEYLVSSGKSANNIRSLTYASTIANVTTIDFTPDSPSGGGDDRDSIDRIKFAAPKAFSAQNRAITAEDYTAILLKESNVGSVTVWGGEDNDPPAYGKVYIAIKPTTGTALTATEKQDIINTILKPKKVLTVSTEIVDPEFIYLLLNVTVNYDPAQTILNEESIESKIFDVIKNYNTNEINQFSRYFRYSKLSRLIDTCERSILNTIMRVVLRKETNVQLGSPSRYVLNFSNPIDSGTVGRPTSHPYGVGNQVTSNAFTYNGFPNCFLEDNNGIMRIYRAVGSSNIGVSQNTGTINYSTGRIVLNAFNPSAFADGGVTLKLNANPSNLDVLPLRGQILSIRDADIDINLQDDTQISLVRR
jgi:hypothetical protein